MVLAGRGCRGIGCRGAVPRGGAELPGQMEVRQTTAAAVARRRLGGIRHDETMPAVQFRKRWAGPNTPAGVPLSARTRHAAQSINGWLRPADDDRHTNLAVSDAIEHR
jgi:hypothetical protein